MDIGQIASSNLVDTALAVGLGYVAGKTGINISAVAVKRVAAWLFTMLARRGVAKK